MVTAVRGDDAIRGMGKTRFTDVRRVAETGSTNADLLDEARRGAPEGVVLVADRQTAGRGRAGRSWTTPPGAALLCSILVRPPEAVGPLVTFALAVAAAEAVEETSGVQAGLKWPNDLVVESDGRTRKLAGILAEAEWPVAHEPATIVIGIGLNIAWGTDVPEDLADIAVALDHLVDEPPDRDTVLATILTRFEVHYARLLAGDVDGVLADWRSRSATLHREVRVDLGSEQVTGTAVDVDDDGHLILETGSGRRTIAVGDVVHLRPVD